MEFPVTDSLSWKIFKVSPHTIPVTSVLDLTFSPDPLVFLTSSRKTVVVGSGYIAVELAGIMNALGSDVSIIVRYNKVHFHGY